MGQFLRGHVESFMLLVLLIFFLIKRHRHMLAPGTWLMPLGLVKVQQETNQNKFVIY